MPESQTEPGPAWALVELLGSPDPAGRTATVARLRALGRSAAPALERGLTGHPRDAVRRWCAQLLAEGGRRASACAIVGATHDRTAAVRLLALQTLADPVRAEEFGLDPVPHLARLARHDRSKRVRQAAVDALRLRLPDARAASALSASAEERHTPSATRRARLTAPAEAEERGSPVLLLH